MSLSGRILSAVRPAALAIHGGDVTFTYSGDTPFTVQAIRRPRNSEETGEAGAFERLLTNRGQFATAPRLPDKGDTVNLGDTEYVVISAHPDKDPESDGLSIYIHRTEPTSSLWSIPTAS